MAPTRKPVTTCDRLCWRKIIRELPTMPAMMRIKQNHHNGLKVNNMEKAIKAPAKPPIAAV